MPIRYTVPVPEGSIGISLKSGEYPPVVVKIDKNSPLKDSQIKSGYELVAIKLRDGTALEKMNTAETIAALKKYSHDSGRRLIFVRREPMPPYQEKGNKTPKTSTTTIHRGSSPSAAISSRRTKLDRSSSSDMVPSRRPKIRVQRVPSKELSREEVIEKLGLDRHNHMMKQAKSVTNLNFQQAINCCGFTSVSYALSAIGCPTSVDDIFQKVGVNVESAVGDGMTLAEMYEASLRYVSLAQLPVFVECYHFDEAKATAKGFRKACQADADAGIDDLMILNFHSGVAHGWKKGGGGHFSVLTGLEDNEDNVVMADVHGIKYGSFWSTPLKQMFEAMQDRDSCGRSRGALRFGRTDKSRLTRPLPGMMPTLFDWCAPPAAYSQFQAALLRKYIPARWDANLGVRNMEGVSALASAMRILEGDDAAISRLDSIMRALKESYTWHLNNFASPDKIVEMSNQLRREGLTTVTAHIKGLGNRLTARSLKKALEESKCGKPGVVVMVSYDFNEAYGAPMLKREKGEAGALSHGVRSWSLIAAMNQSAAADDANGVVISPAHNIILAGRLWTTSFANMAKAIQTLANGSPCKLVVLKACQNRCK